jgi:Ca2+-binding EF-hand superfamily protein
MKYLISVLAIALAAPVLAQSQQQMDPSQVFLKTFDANNDGKVSRDEYVKPQVQQIEKQFGYMDKNGDGSVDGGEAAAFAEEMRNRMQQQQQGGARR